MLTMQNGTKYYRENELEKFGYVKIEELNKQLNQCIAIDMNKDPMFNMKAVSEELGIKLIEKDKVIFKEELKEQIEHILQYEIDAAFPSSNDFKNCIEKILKLLE